VVFSAFGTYASPVFCIQFHIFCDRALLNLQKNFFFDFRKTYLLFSYKMLFLE